MASTHLLALCLIASTLFVSSLAQCGNNQWDSGEQCDGGAHCNPDCSCAFGYGPTAPPSIDCMEICLNPIDPLTFYVTASLNTTLLDSKVDFHAFMTHQTTGSTGSTVTGTSIVFGAGSTCDYPANNFLSLSLNSTTCFDDFGFLGRPFSQFSPCLTMVCRSSNGSVVPNCDPSLCISPPCSKVWEADVFMTRTYNILNQNGDSFPTSVAAYQPLAYIFPWVLSASLNTVAWATPNVPASAALTGVIYDPTSDSWTVTVQVNVRWPYKLVVSSTDKINGLVYAVSDCAVAPAAGGACLQTINFTSSGCTSLHTIFGGVSAAFSNLKYQCSDSTSSDCPLLSGETRNAVLQITLDSTVTCGTVSTGVQIAQTDITFLMKQPDFVTDRNSFIYLDKLDFLLQITKNIPQAAISDISVVSFSETKLHSGINFATTRVTSPAPCNQPSSLCFDFESVQLTNLPENQRSANLTFTVLVDITYNGISKKRVALEANRDFFSSKKRAAVNFLFSTDATVQTDSTSTSGSDVVKTGFLALLVPFLYFLL